MSQFGEDLRRERECRGVSLEALCAETRVNSRHLIALEHGDFGELPGGVFRRGIVRAYLGALQLNEELWMPRFQQEMDRYAELTGRVGTAGDQAWAAFAESVKRGRVTPEKQYRVRWIGVLILWLLLTAAAWAAWHFVLRGRVSG